MNRFLALGLVLATACGASDSNENPAEYVCVHCLGPATVPVVMPARVDGANVTCPAPTGCQALQPGVWPENAVDYRYAPPCHDEMSQSCLCADGPRPGSQVAGRCVRQPRGDLAWECPVARCL